MKIVVNNTKKKSDIQQWADYLRAKWEANSSGKNIDRRLSAYRNIKNKLSK